jgi:tetratricopeptide (TPR) repeat protein
MSTMPQWKTQDTMKTWLLAILVAVLTVQLTSGAQEPARARQAYERAVALEAEGNYAAALSLLWEASGLAPRDADIQNRLGEALERLGALDAAVDAFRNALAERPAFRKASNNLILALVKAGKGPEAVARARVLVAEAPRDPDRYFTLGLAQSEQDVEGAIATFGKVLELEPRHTLARYNLALVLRRADRLPEALAELERAQAIEPRPETYYTMGVIYWHLGDLDRAASALRAAVAAQPRYADAYHALGSVLKETRDWTGASASLRRAIAIRPDLPASHYTLGQVLQLGGDERGARAEFDEAERLRRRAALEHEALVWTSVGIQKAGAGDLTAALSSFRRATSAYEPYAPAHYQTGLVLQRLGQPEASRAAFERARTLNPSLVPPPDIR